MSVHAEGYAQYKKMELQPTTVESIELWYGNLRPDRDINEIPLATHLDGIASSVLFALDTEVPDSQSGRIRRALEYTTSGADKLIAPIAADGAKNFVLLDLLTELPERTETPPAGVVLKLLDFGARTALAMRENPALPLEERFKANGKLANLRLAELRFANSQYPEKIGDFSDRYIAAVRQEAQWDFMNIPRTYGVPGGTLFETYIGCLAKYQAWAMEKDEETLVRHATLREDSPNEAAVGGSGHEVSHDVVIEGEAGIERLQCKWGVNTPKTEKNYDLSKITMVVEAGADGVFEHYEDFKAAFYVLAHSDQPDKMELCDDMAQRYNLGRSVRHASESVQISIGEQALTAV